MEEEFIAWLKSPHADDVMVQTEVESEEEEATQPIRRQNAKDSFAR